MRQLRYVFGSVSLPDLAGRGVVGHGHAVWLAFLSLNVYPELIRRR